MEETKDFYISAWEKEKLRRIREDLSELQAEEKRLTELGWLRQELVEARDQRFTEIRNTEDFDLRLGLSEPRVWLNNYFELAFFKKGNLFEREFSYKKLLKILCTRKSMSFETCKKILAAGREYVYYILTTDRRRDDVKFQIGPKVCEDLCRLARRQKKSPNECFHNVEDGKINHSDIKHQYDVLTGRVTETAAKPQSEESENE